MKCIIAYLLGYKGLTETTYGCIFELNLNYGENIFY